MKIVGRGRGSGKGGHTTGRGHKGQLARERVHSLFEGTKIKKSLIKRLPFIRGKAKNKSFVKKPEILKLDLFAKWPKSIPVTLENLIERKFVKPGTTAVKILGGAKLDHELVFKVPTSK
ncbi:MAG: uL15 family ribosomal protein, partial [Patescibacteria group bacterium]